MAVPDTGPADGSITATGPERGRVKVPEQARVTVKARNSDRRGRVPAGSGPVPFPAAVEVPARDQVRATITEPVRDKAPTMATVDTGTTPAPVPVAGTAAVPVAITAPVRVADTGAGRGLVAATDLMTLTVPRTATVTATARPPLSPSTCGRSSRRF